MRLPVHIVERLSAVRRTTQELLQELGREPELAEIATALGLSEEELRGLLGVAEIPLSLDATFDGESDSTDLMAMVSDVAQLNPFDQVYARIRLRSIAEAIYDLPQRERMVLVMRYGLGEQEPWTLGEIGEHFRISRERVRQIEAKALERLRYNGLVRRLKETA